MNNSFREQIEELITVVTIEHSHYLGIDSIKDIEEAKNFMLAEYLNSCLKLFDNAISNRDSWIRFEIMEK